MKIKKISLFALSIAFVLASCGDASKKTESKEMSHDEMHEEGVDHEDEDHNHEAMEEKADDTSIPEVPVGAKVYFANLEDGQKVTSPLKVEFGVDGMRVEPAGELNDYMGHHHIIINGGFMESGAIVPADSLHIHFGKGQTETELDLPKGEHSLTLQFADGYHRSYGQQMSATIRVVVE